MNINLGGKNFKPFISNAQILDRIKVMALEINQKLKGHDIDILVIMEGAEAFSKTMIPLLSFDNRCHYMKIKTYEGMTSVSKFNVDILWVEKLKGREILILEDIIDSGSTVHNLLERFGEWDIKKIHLATLLLKPDQLKYPIKPDFTGFEIGPDFVVGFGMDYNEQGRDLVDIYSCINP